jgi:hypothetical protein
MNFPELPVMFCLNWWCSKWYLSSCTITAGFRSWLPLPRRLHWTFLVLEGGWGSRRVLRPISFRLPTTKRDPPFCSWILRSWLYTCTVFDLWPAPFHFLVSIGSTLPLGSEALSAISSHFRYESVLQMFWLAALVFRWLGCYWGLLLFVLVTFHPSLVE